MRIAVLGAGMVGRTIAIDLSKSYTVTCFDIDQKALTAINKKHPEISVVQADLSQYGLYPKYFSEFDLLVSAVPGFMGYKTLEAIISMGKQVADISFFPEDALELDSLAKAKNVTAIVDCGVAPGMSNLILGYCNGRFEVKKFECYVGGLPKIRSKPFEYKAPFSPIDVLEEYQRPARYVENGHLVTKPALSDAELMQFEKAGTLEAFNTDGLRSILFTMKHIPDMIEKTLRYPGHIELIKMMKLAGLFSPAPVNVKGSSVRPIDFTSALLFDAWKLNEDDEEFTIMKVNVAGVRENAPYSCSYFLYDEYDPETKTASMSRTTGYACTAFVNLITKKLFTSRGVFPPELVGSDVACFNFVLEHLRERNVNYQKSEGAA